MSGEWIEWNGGKCPVADGTLVDVQYRDGKYTWGAPANVKSDEHPVCDASPSFWKNDNQFNDIVRYRVVRYRVVAAEDEWIEWNGGECPVDGGTLVEVVLRFGVHLGTAGTVRADNVRWNHTNNPIDSDIVRYRVRTVQSAADAGMLPIEPVTEHPLTAIFAAALAQVTNGKGAERHANGAEFMDQPWLHLANVHGNGFLTGQAAKKLDEAQGMSEHDRWEREMLGAIVYAAMAIIHRRGVK